MCENSFLKDVDDMTDSVVEFRLGDSNDPNFSTAPILARTGSRKATIYVHQDVHHVYQSVCANPIYEVMYTRGFGKCRFIKSFRVDGRTVVIWVVQDTEKGMRKFAEDGRKGGSFTIVDEVKIVPPEEWDVLMTRLYKGSDAVFHHKPKVKQSGKGFGKHR